MFGSLLLALTIFTATSPHDTIPVGRVIIVRHAEKASQTEKDPSLSEAGRARAAALDSVTSTFPISTIFVTTYKRTAETAELVAKRHGVTPMALSPADIPAYATALADSVRRRGGDVLIISHSNTIAAIIHALGGPKQPDLCDPAYSHLFTVTMAGTEKAKVVDTRFGAKDPPDADICATGMKVVK